MERDGQEEEPDGALVAEEAERHALEDLVEAERQDDQETSNHSLDEGHKLGIRVFRALSVISGNSGCDNFLPISQYCYLKDN